MYKVAQDLKSHKLSYGRPSELYPVSLKKEGKEKSDLSFSKSLTGIETSDAKLGGLCPLHVPQHLKPLSGITIGQSISHLLSPEAGTPTYPAAAHFAQMPPSKTAPHPGSYTDR
jgi:hypothetical protein